MVLAGHGQAPSHAASTPPQIHYLTAPFDASADRLAPYFRGHDVMALLKAVEYSPALAEKKEFETTAAFNARMVGFAQHQLYGSLTATSRLAFLVPRGAGPESGATFSYDADAQILTATFALAEEAETRHPVVVLKHTSRQTGSYVASNAFGAHALVRRYHDADYGIAFLTDLYDDSILNYADGGRIQLRMSAEKARRLKPGLRLLLVLKLFNPWANYGTSSQEATISDPYEYTTESHNLYAVLESVWVFDERTGEVINKAEAGGESLYPEECKGAGRASDEPFADCVKRVRRRNEVCSAYVGDAHQACIDRINSGSSPAAAASSRPRP